MALDRKLDVVCGWCGKKSHLGTWNDLTYSRCTNREMKRAFTPLTERKAFLRKSDTFYVCPLCGKWSRGSQLRITNTNDKSLLSLGGESVMSIGRSNMLEETKNIENKNENLLLRNDNIEEKIKKAEMGIKNSTRESVRITHNTVVDLDSLM